MIRIECGCGRTGEVPDAMAGKKGLCQGCGKVYGLASIEIEPRTGQPQFSFTIATPMPADAKESEVTP